MSKRILVTGSSIKDALLQPLIDAGYDVVHPSQTLNEAQLIEQLKGTSAYLYGGDEEASPAALSTAAQLKLIAFYGVGYESFLDVPAVKTLGISITNTPGTLTNSVAEMTVGQLINCRRRLGAYSHNYMLGLHGNEELQHDLSGHKIGIVGLGAIGTRIAEILTLGFNCEVLYYSRTRKPDEEKRLGIRYSLLTDMFKEVDAVVIMTPGNQTTASLIGTEVISAAKPGMLLVNTARPEIVDPEALLEGLSNKRIAYAAFDKFYAKSEVSAKLLELQPEKLTITNHIGSLTHDARDAMSRKAVSSILNFLSSGDDPYLVA